MVDYLIKQYLKEPKCGKSGLFSEMKFRYLKKITQKQIFTYNVPLQFF